MGKVKTERDRLGSPRCLLNDYHQYLLNIALITLRCALVLTSMFFSLFKTQLTKGQRYRFSLIINELKNAEVVPYMTTCLAFINTILIATEDFEERVRLRNEFAGERGSDWYQGPVQLPQSQVLSLSYLKSPDNEVGSRQENPPENTENSRI